MIKLVGFSDYFQNSDKTLLEAALNDLNINQEKIKNESKNLLKKNKDKEKKGLLIVFEGPDGAGKSSQVDNLSNWLKKEKGYSVVLTKWNSSKIMKSAIKNAKEKRCLSPILYSLMHAADMVLRYENDIVQALMENKIVIADRYVYTSMVRDKARGVDIKIMDEIYKGFREPDLLFHCSVPVDVALGRLMKGKDLSYYGSGMDLELADTKEENYLKYGKMMDEIYEEVLPKKSSIYYKINMNRDMTKIFNEIKSIVEKKIS
jgi:dTMP kinase